jgi:N-acetylglucosamine malate deacetylase 2
MKPQPFLSFVMVALLTSATVAQNGTSPRKVARKQVRVLLVVAHPDDEYEVAGTVYRISKELFGTVDQVIITDGEAGYRYSSLAVPYYGIDLTNEAVGRARLPGIRKEEARRAGRILGIQPQWFLNEKDDRFTLDAGESLHRSWHEERILRVLQQRLSKGHYDFVFVLLPSEQTHGEHKAASILAFEAIELLPYMTLKSQIRYSCLNCSKLLQRAIRRSGQYVSVCEIMGVAKDGRLAQLVRASVLKAGPNFI